MFLLCFTMADQVSHNVSRLAGKYLLKMIKRWPSMISKCVLSHTENLRNPKAPEYAVLGSCAVLATQTVLKHLTMVIIQFKLLPPVSVKIGNY